MKFFFNKSIAFSSSNEEKAIHGLTQTLKKLYRCRDLEISNLWQRSIFLAVFLTLLLSSYGILFSKILENNKANIKLFCIAAICLSIIGIIFSIIWIMMSKSSKAWYEVYENAITGYEKEHRKELGIPRDYRMGKMPPKEIDNSLSSTKAGGYSPSKINILIGQVFWFIWIVIYTIHAFILPYDILNDNKICDNNIYILVFISAVCSGSVYFVNLLVKYILKKKARSGFLNGE